MKYPNKIITFFYLYLVNLLSFYFGTEIPKIGKSVLNGL